MEQVRNGKKSEAALGAVDPIHRESRAQTLDSFLLKCNRGIPDSSRTQIDTFTPPLRLRHVSANSALKQTPLHEEHVRLGAKMVDFGGWSMPVQYSGIIDEHNAVRTGLGVFDISHMGQFFADGDGALAWLNELLTNNVERLAVGECQYTLLLNETGGVIDDLIVYRIGDTSFLMVVNAAKIDEDFAWMQVDLPDGVEFHNYSPEFAGLAVQGPRSAQLFDAFFQGKFSRPARNEILTVKIDDQTYYIARTGYTGEDGFEVFCSADRGVKSWNDILRKGAEFGIKPCGLGARDTLRLEMCYPLNGSDLLPDTTPIEAGLSIFVDLQKPRFIGRDALLRQRQEGVKRRLVPFKMTDAFPLAAAALSLRRLTRMGQPEDRRGLQRHPLADSQDRHRHGLHPHVQFARINEQIEIEIRGKRFPAVIEKKPLHRASTAA